MRIEIEIGESEFPESEVETVTRNAGIEDGDAETALQKVAKAAFIEYKQMFLEKGMPSKADEVMQERLLYLIRYFYVDRLPAESEIQTVFQLTASKSKSLLKNTRTRFRTTLEPQIRASVTSVIQSARESKGKWRMIIQSSNILEEMNEIVSREGPSLQKLVAVRGSASLYECPESTLNLLKEQFKL